jgi:hypothetical protein
VVAEQMQALSPSDISLDLGAGRIFELNTTRLRSQKAGDGAQKARLAGAVRARQRPRLAATQAEAQACEQLAFAPHKRQVFYGQPPDHQPPL